MIHILDKDATKEDNKHFHDTNPNIQLRKQKYSKHKKQQKGL